MEIKGTNVGSLFEDRYYVIECSCVMGKNSSVGFDLLSLSCVLQSLDSCHLMKSWYATIQSGRLSMFGPQDIKRVPEYAPPEM